MFLITILKMRKWVMTFVTLLCFLAYWTTCNVIQQSFAIHKGYYLASEAFHTITSASHTSCLIECESFAKCRGVNVAWVAIESKFLCQLSNCSFSVQNTPLVESETSTHYKSELSQKGTDCQAWKDNGFHSNGIFTLTSYWECNQINVYCDMSTDDQGWILLQKRFDGSVSFFRTWEEYKNGFGSLNSEFWLGLEHAHQLMKNGTFTLRFDLWYGTEYAYMEYYDVTIADEADKYRLDWQGTPAGNAGNSLDESKGHMFSTKDSDNDIAGGYDCATKHYGGWWFSNCGRSHLNGNYGNNNNNRGIAWETFKGAAISKTKSEIKFKIVS